MNQPVDPMGSNTDLLLMELAACLEQGTLDVSAETLELMSQDVYRAGAEPMAVARPKTTQEVAALVKVANAHQLPLYVRGGGMSYTDAYYPEEAGALTLDMASMDQIREINAHDLYVTVEAGCTWKTLNEALAPHGVRPTFWGPMSGKLSTIGGAMAQGAVTFGSSRNGPSMAAALGVELVLGSGEILRTGSAGQPGHSAFYREYGPDLTGLVCGDAGALGIKTAVTMRLEPVPATGRGLSFSFSSYTNLVEAIRRVSRYKLATEIFGAETELVKRVAGPPDLKSDLRQLLTLFRSADNPLAGLRKVLKVALNGRRFMEQSAFLANFLTEGTDSVELKWMLRRIRQEIGDLGIEVADTVAEFTRAQPFPDPMLLGPENRRLLPLHGVVPYSSADPLHNEYRAYIDSIQDRCSQHGVEVYIVYATTGSAGFLYECVIYWPDHWPQLHQKHTADEILSAVDEPEDNPEGRALVEEIRRETIEIFYRHGAIHFQIGRAYPFARDRNPAALKLLTDLRDGLDPNRLINPGALGL